MVKIESLIKALLIIAMMTGSFFMGVAYSVNNSQNYSKLNELLDGKADYLIDLYDLIQSQSIQDIDNNKIFYGIAKGMVSGLGDQYSEYYDPEEASVFWDDVNGKYEGVGIEISLDEGMAKVISVLPESPAELSGIKTGDIILAVDGQDIEGKVLGEIAYMIRGTKGTKVALTILSGDEVKNYEIERSELVAYSVMSKIDSDILYISISRFDNNTDKEVISEIEKYNLNEIKGIILDLRNNPGGYFDSAVSVADLFLPEGMIVSERSKNNNLKEYSAHSGDLLENYKVVVLVNEYSASAAEILAGALHDNNRGTLVGQQTYGKGSVQEVDNLSDGAIIKFTVAEWLTPDGTNLRQEGITPDYQVELDETDNDLQFQKAVSILKGEV